MPQTKAVEQREEGERPEVVPAHLRPLYGTVLKWAEKSLQGQGAPVPLVKRLAVLITGLVAGERATVSHWASTVADLAITTAREESIVRRLERILGDGRLDPEKVLPAVFRAWLPELLAGQVAAHAANEGTGAAHHRRFLPIHLIIDESSKEDQVHLLVIGLVYQGIVLPLAVRCWPQNTTLPEGAYWTQLGSLLWEVHGLLPPVLRDHVLVLADRGYGYPRWLDLLQSLNWSYVVRAQEQARVCLPDGTIGPLRDLAPRPGAVWLGGFADLTEAASATAGDEPITVFKNAGWRFCRVVAVWAVGQPSPWLLLTNLPAAAARLREYAQRWAIERLFLSWKSHGWDLEASGVRDPARLGRLLTGLVLATWWRLALALPTCLDHLTDLADRAARRAAPDLTPRQLPLPWPRSDLPDPTGAPPPSPADRPHRPWAAKFSLLTWGAKVARRSDFRSQTPALCWSFPSWEAPLWSAECQRVYAHSA